MALKVRDKKKKGGESYADLMKAADMFAAQYEDDVALTEASNAAVDLVRTGKLDEAEQAAAISWYASPTSTTATIGRAWPIYEARGDNKQAAHDYRQALEFIREHPTCTPIMIGNCKPSSRGWSPS